MKQATLKNPSKMKKLSQAPALIPSSSEKPKGRFLKLEVMRSNNEGLGFEVCKDVYVVDGLDLLGLIGGKIPFIEVPAMKTPGIRFITLTYEK